VLQGCFIFDRFVVRRTLGAKCFLLAANAGCGEIGKV